MKYPNWVRLSALFFAVAAPPAMAAVSLEDAYRAALRRSEVVADQQELVTQAEEHYRQATGSVLPTVTGTAQETWAQAPAAGFSTFSPSSQPLVKLSASQPLFRGFREFAGIRQTRKLVNAQTAAWKSASLTTYQDVATNYYSLLSFEQDLRNLAEQQALLEKRIQELQGRVKIGRSRVSEVLTIEATRSTLLAEIEQVRGQQTAGRVAFGFLTGLPEDTAIEDARPAPPAGGGVENYLALVDQRPDVQTALEKKGASTEGVDIAKGAHLPSVDLSGNYYLKRYGVSEAVHWDVLLALTLPIYAGGVIQSRVREAASLDVEQDLSLSRTRRLADEQIRTFHERLRTDQAQLQALSQAAEINERNYKVESQEYRLGLVTNIEVLQALSSYEEAKRSRDRLLYAVKLDWVNLESAVGRTPDSVPAG